MKIAIIGSGNVATHLALALNGTEHEVVQVYSRTLSHALELADLLYASTGKRCDATDTTSGIVRDADAYIFSVKDDALPSIISNLRDINDEAVMMHTAGSVPLSIFENHARHYGVLYPMQTFSKHRRVEFRKVPCFTESNDETADFVIKSLANAISESVHELSSEKRKSLHLAAVFACNFTNHCYRLAEKVLEDADIDFSLFLPLIDETARKVHEISPREGQTGPAVRLDETVINRHIGMLTDDTMRNVYKLMSESIHNDQQ